MASTSPSARGHATWRCQSLCNDDNLIVVVSADGEHWDLLAGRPEGQESHEETLRWEMLEEACATVKRTRLVGYMRGEGVAGAERGPVPVRSVSQADVELDA